MNIVFISEHYFPRIGGVTTYVKNIFEHSSSVFEKIILIVPFEGENGKIVSHNNGVNSEILVGLGSNLTGNILPKKRKEFIELAYQYLKGHYQKEKFDAIHVLFGLYTMQYFNFQYFRSLGVKCGVTIHNVPPAECGISWSGDVFYEYIKDEIRKIGVGIINKRRIQSQDFDLYVVPSHHVKKLLEPLVQRNKIKVVGHGIIAKHIIKYENANKNYIQILCVGGFVPHKRQDSLIDIAIALYKKGYQIRWIMVGPIRNKNYFDFVNKKIRSNSHLQVEIKVSIPQDELNGLYLSSDLYIQPSSEEGFCLTALDAASYGLPIVGTLTGALPEIIEKGYGIISDFNPSALEKAVTIMVKSLDSYKEKAQSKLPEVINHFNWDIAVLQLKQGLENN